MATPSAPIITLAPRSSNGTLEYKWSAPTSGSPNLYELALSGGGGTFTTSGTYYAVTGLTNGTIYTATVRASSDGGSTYGPTAAFRPFAPGSGVPGAPATATAVSLDSYTSAMVSWTAPASSPDSPIFWYVITSSSNNGSDPVIKRTANGLTQTSLKITGLNPASTYTFNVQAVNCPGYGPATTTTSVGPPTKGSAIFAVSTYYSMSPGITIGTNDYTFELWFKLPVLPIGFTTFPFFGPTGPGGLGAEIFFNNPSGTPVSQQINVTNLGGTNLSYSFPLAISPLVANTWYFVAGSRTGSSLNVWIGTTPGGTASQGGGGAQADTRNFTGSTNLIARTDGYGVPSETLQITNIRIINGTALYTPSNTTITIPSVPLTNITNTQLLYLTSSSGTLATDTSGTQTLTATGTPTWSSQNPFP
jgi:hypothetical protein